MNVIPPMQLTEARVTSSTAAEPGPGETAWSAATAYSIGDHAILGSPSAAVTISNASPSVVTWVANGLAVGTPLVLSTTEALPAGLTAGMVYYVKSRLTADTFTVSTSMTGAAVNTTSAGSGVHTCVAQVHKVYEALTAHTNKPPMLNTADWAELGATNRWAMFDLLRNGRTAVASPLTVVVTPGERIDALAVLGVVGTSIDMSVSSAAGGGVVYSASVDLSTRHVTDWYEYFFRAFTYRTSIVKFDLPPYTDAVITVTITNTGAAAECGALVLGRAEHIGDAQSEAESDVLNFSSVTRDAFGNAEMVQRRNVPKTVQALWLEKDRVDSVRDLRDALNARPAVWAGVEDDDDGYFQSLLILGFYRRFSINLRLPQHAIISLELEEV